MFVFFLTSAYFLTRSFTFQKLSKIFQSLTVLTAEFLSVCVWWGAGAGAGSWLERRPAFSVPKTFKVATHFLRPLHRLVPWFERLFSKSLSSCLLIIQVSVKCQSFLTILFNIALLPWLCLMTFSLIFLTLQHLKFYLLDYCLSP